MIDMSTLVVGMPRYQVTLTTFYFDFKRVVLISPRSFSGYRFKSILTEALILHHLLLEQLLAFIADADDYDRTCTSR